jgi:hypothetical protein
MLFLYNTPPYLSVDVSKTILSSKRTTFTTVISTVTFQNFSMSSSISDLDSYVIRAWSRSIQNWVIAKAIPIPDTNPNWVSYKQYETLNGTVPRPQFETINSVTSACICPS